MTVSFYSRCYLQTELGHGSNVACLETTAAYLPESQEFEIHSPTLTSTKWWIGGLGKTATHGIVQAKLILPGGKDMGLHLFLVQLRSLGMVHPYLSKFLSKFKFANLNRGPQRVARYFHW